MSFAACSFLQLPPIVWFGLGALGLAYFLSRPIDHPRAEAPLTDKPGGWAPYVFLALIPLVTLPTSGVGVSTSDLVTRWSPYYRIDYSPKTNGIWTNLIGHQAIQTRDRAAVEPYALPHLFRRDVTGADGKPAWPEFKRILIIGAGSGNDLSRALQWTGPETRGSTRWRSTR